MREGEFFTVLSDRQTAALILALYEANKPVIMKDLQGVTNHTQTLRQRLDSMEAEGIVVLDTVYSPHKYVNVSLTDVGKEIALLVSMANTIIPGDISGKSINMRYADPILRLLRGKEYVVQKDIKAVMPYYDSITKVLAKMEKEGLVTRSVSSESYREIRYALTPMGKQVADAFEMINDKLTDYGPRRRSAECME
ncbi:MAG: winged helix-turn-helix transcriptional regulator [Candidatus Methanomethylophilaceae archaeon]|nr:winged helix-turn-helix transcriptional regulator [Candidatus Methanomethylophilaceae archaeon]